MYKYILELKEWQKHKLKGKNTNHIIIASKKDHGLFIKVKDVIIALDCWIPGAELIFISHAHMDHIPLISPEILQKIKENKLSIKFICTKITKEIVELRTNFHFSIPESAWLMGKNLKLPQSKEYKGINLTIFDNGHTPGSIGIMIEAEERIIYTGDFINEKRVLLDGSIYTEGLKPIPCDYLITECTYGDPYFSFPSFNEVYLKLNEIVQENLDQGKLIIIACDTLGKAQIIHKMLLCKEEIILDKNIAAIARVLENNEYTFPKWAPYQKYNKNKLKKERNHVLIIPSYSLNKSPYNELINPAAIIILASGRVLLKSYRKENNADIYLLLSNHADFKGILNTILEFNPKILFLEHGEIEKTFYAIHSLNKKRLKSIKFLKTPYWT
ncbi:MAG: hypothetical protein ACTSWY_02905 [Promethearchaeota archaeon]